MQAKRALLLDEYLSSEKKNELISPLEQVTSSIRPEEINKMAKVIVRSSRVL